MDEIIGIVDKGGVLDTLIIVVILMGILYIIFLAYIIKREWKAEEEKMEKLYERHQRKMKKNAGK